jgi:chromosome segregation ATPase
MADATAYFKTAAGAIRNAAMVKRTEIDELRRSIDDKHRETNQLIDQLKTQIREKQADMARTQDQQQEPDKDRATKLREIMELQGVITDKTHEAGAYRDQVSSAIHSLESQVQSYEQQARQLEAQR